jgi:hypothetical protein
MVEYVAAAGTVIKFGGETVSKIEEFCSGGEYHNVNRRFHFTFQNSTGIALKLVYQDKWFGYLETPNKYVPPHGNLAIRGYKRSDNASGVTYLLGFQFDPNEIKTEGILYVYLQVGYSADNYYGWSFEKEKVITAEQFYDSARFNQINKGSEADHTLNKGGTKVKGTIAGRWSCEMITDNQSDSFPKLSLSNL